MVSSVIYMLIVNDISWLYAEPCAGHAELYDGRAENLRAEVPFDSYPVQRCLR